MGAASSQVSRAGVPAAAAVAASAAPTKARKVFKTSLTREVLALKRQQTHVRAAGRPALAEMDSKVLHAAERFEDTVDKVEFLETDMTAFHETAAGRRAASDGPVRMPTDKTAAANSGTFVDTVPGRFTDRQFRELLRLHRESPDAWPDVKLAAHFQADLQLVRNIVTHCCPPKISPPTSTVTHPTGTWWTA
ncbi:Aste57867_3578 [Aphanomyces stellatus]|uniref:Aste57867_3578 protein n=1 Tax=Aphanomyces stellatus TaxID=120398 RepID=A0A485K9Z7_9STRA|nr:hypothetical protein As57867_003567 [Aphanomyces stellatus]VFT80739.1 Aste57867_3578 [Aphanomyces stellatus]